MAKQEQTMTREDRVSAYVDALTKLTTQAEQVKDAPKPVADFTRKVNALVGYVESLNGDSAQVADALIGAGFGDAWLLTIDTLRVIGTSLTSTGEGPTREEGDALAKKLSALVDADLVDEEESDKFTALVTRWRASAPKGSKGGASKGGASSTPRASLGFTVKATCEKAGCEWSTSTSTDNLNSVRDLCLNKHARKAHGFTGSTELSAGLTNALAAVGMTSTKAEKGEANAAQGGGFLVTRSA